MSRAYLLEMSKSHVICPASNFPDGYSYATRIGRLPNALYHFWERNSFEQETIDKLIMACKLWCNLASGDKSHNQFIKDIITSSWVFHGIVEQAKKEGNQVTFARIPELRSYFCFAMALQQQRKTLKAMAVEREWFSVITATLASHYLLGAAKHDYSEFLDLHTKDPDVFHKFNIFPFELARDNKLERDSFLDELNDMMDNVQEGVDEMEVSDDYFIAAKRDVIEKFPEATGSEDEMTMIKTISQLKNYKEFSTFLETPGDQYDLFAKNRKFYAGFLQQSIFSRLKSLKPYAGIRKFDVADYMTAYEIEQQELKRPSSPSEVKKTTKRHKAAKIEKSPEIVEEYEEEPAKPTATTEDDDEAKLMQWKTSQNNKVTELASLRKDDLDPEVWSRSEGMPEKSGQIRHGMTLIKYFDNLSASTAIVPYLDYLFSVVPVASSDDLKANQRKEFIAFYDCIPVHFPVMGTNQDMNDSSLEADNVFILGKVKEFNGIQEAIPWEILIYSRGLLHGVPKGAALGEINALEFVKDVYSESGSLLRYDQDALESHPFAPSDLTHVTEMDLIALDLHPCVNPRVWQTRSELGHQIKFNKLPPGIELETLSQQQNFNAISMHWDLFSGGWMRKDHLLDLLVNKIINPSNLTWRNETIMHVFCRSCESVQGKNSKLDAMIAVLQAMADSADKKDWATGDRRHALFDWLVRGWKPTDEKLSSTILLSVEELGILHCFGMIDDALLAEMWDRQQYMAVEITEQIKSSKKLPSAIHMSHAKAHFEEMENSYYIHELGAYVLSMK